MSSMMSKPLSAAVATRTSSVPANDLTIRFGAGNFLRPVLAAHQLSFRTQITSFGVTLVRT